MCEPAENKQNSIFCHTLAFAKHFFYASFLCVGTLTAQTSYTFTPAGATGSAGPTQAQINSSYLGSNLSGSVVSVNGIQSFTLPMTGGYRIEAWGASGAGTGTMAGLGAYIRGDFTLSAGQVVKVLVGQSGASNGSQWSGGGGSFVSVGNNTILVIAGGGGGFQASSTNANGNITASGANGLLSKGTIASNGGTNGSGGGSVCRAGGGGGWSSNGASSCSGSSSIEGKAFINGGYGGSTSTGVVGGFGGGGAAEGGTSALLVPCGGGGGYSGGGGTGSGSSSGLAASTRAGGGGSWNTGVWQVNTGGVNFGDGKVIITKLCDVAITATGVNAGNSICAGKTITLSSTGTTNHVWNTGATTKSIVVSPTATANYTVSSTSTVGCVGTGTIKISISGAAPVLSIVNTASANFCLGKTATLTASGATSYTWSGGTSPITNGIGFNPSSSAIYTVVGTNTCGIGSATTAVNVSTIPINTSNSPTLVCVGSTVNLDASTSLPNFTWQPGNLHGSSPAVSPSVSTIYTVTASDGTCVSTKTLALNTSPVPTLNLIGNVSTICLGDSVDLLVSGADSYTWTSDASADSTFDIYTTVSSFPSAGLYNIYALGSDTLGCKDTAVWQVNVHPLPVLTASASRSLICLYDSCKLDVTGADFFQWSLNANNATNDTVSVNPTITSTYVVTGTLNSTGCMNATNVVVNVYSPSLTVTTPTTLCTGGVITLTGQVSNTWAGASNSYTWSVPGMADSISHHVTVAPLSPLVATLQVSSTTIDSLVCYASYTTGLSLFPTPIPLTTPPSSICVGSSISLNAQTSNSVSGASYNYTWSVPGLPDNLSSSVTFTPLVPFVATLTVHSKNTESLLCVASKTTSVYLYPLPTLSVSPSRSYVCTGERVELAAQGASTYTWNNSFIGDTNSVTPPVGMTFVLFIKGTDEHQCENSLVYYLFVNDCQGVSEWAANDDQFHVYPNPSSGSLYIESPVSGHIKLLNELGQIMREIDLQKNDQNILEISGLSKGFYFLFVDGATPIAPRKILVK